VRTYVPAQPSEIRSRTRQECALARAAPFVQLQPQPYPTKRTCERKLAGNPRRDRLFILLSDTLAPDTKLLLKVGVLAVVVEAAKEAARGPLLWAYPLVLNNLVEEVTRTYLKIA
jgi:hypothetical protein